MWDKDGQIWMDGSWVPWREAKIHVLTHTLHYGFGVFEGIRCYSTDKGPAIFRLPEHIDRLFKSAHVLGMTIPHTVREMTEVSVEVIRRNQLDSGYIRPLVYFGAESMGLNPRPCLVHAMVAAWRWGAYLGEEGMEKGIRVKTSSYTRHHPNIVMTRAKAVGNYPNSILAKSEALASGFDEALLLDPEGYVSEGTGENIFIVQGETLKTPPLDSALNGITRNTVISLAATMGLRVLEQRFPRDEIMIADEAFFTGTAAEITPIRELDGRRIGAGSRGEITRKIQERFFAIARGTVPEYAHWLTPVPSHANAG
ncbi:MAG: branched-chain-amino-acid transaminase [Magnetococcales bacterium]|nr:branched-chain-amino-acid transaminase [Magnetococcales bacterium]